MQSVCCRRFNVPQANHQIIGQRVGTARRNIGLYQKKRQQSLPKLCPLNWQTSGYQTQSSHSQSRMS